MSLNLCTATNKMAEVIARFGSDLAETPEGRSWVIKALHPADPITDTRGIPDESSCPTVMFQYNTVARISPPAGSVGTWDFDMTIIPDAICHAVVATDGVDAGGNPLSALVGIMNTALRSPGNLNSTYVERLTNFKNQGIEAHRLAFMSVTAYQDGPALANQGTLCATQYEVTGRSYNLGYVYPAAGPLINYPNAYLPLIRFQDSDLAVYESSQTMPNAYFSESKYGCYLPLKLGQPSHHWTTDMDLVKHAPDGLWTANAGGSWNGVSSGMQGAAPAGLAPYPDVTPAWQSSAVPISPAIYGDPLFKPLNNIWGGVSCRGLSVSSTFSLYFRVGIEARVQPGTLMAPQQRVSPPFDPKALHSYFRINRELKDAYPADFNDLGKIWEAIKSAATIALPMVHPALGPLVAAMRSGGKGGGKGRARDMLPAAQVQRTRDSVTAAGSGGGRLIFSRRDQKLDRLEKEASRPSGRRRRERRRKP